MEACKMVVVISIACIALAVGVTKLKVITYEKMANKELSKQSAAQKFAAHNS